jgi:hypothetical protein
MSAANDGAETDSKMIAVAKNLIFIACPRGSTARRSIQLLLHYYRAFGLNAKTPANGLHGQSKSGSGCAENLGDHRRGHGFAVGQPLRLQLIPRPLLDQEIDKRQPLLLVDRLRQQFSIAIEVISRIPSRIPHRTPLNSRSQCFSTCGKAQ